MKNLLGIDIGTTSLKASVFDEKGNVVKSGVYDYTLNVKGDFVEFPCEEYWNIVKKAFDDMTKDTDVYALAVDTQCETLILTDKDGNPTRDAIVWLDNRAVKQAEEIKAHFGTKRVYDVTGQPEITATWPASKLLWLRENEPEVLKKTERIFLLEDYILYKLTGKFVSEMTLQSSTIYFDIKNKCYWDEMLDYIGIEKQKLPQLVESCKYIGDYNGVKVVTCAIDQIAGAVGAGVINNKIISEMTGTTMVVFMPCDTVPDYDETSIVPCHLNYDGKYCQLVWTSTAGIALKWFKNNFCEQYSFRELDDMAEPINAGANGLTFIPYLCGSTMPRYAPDAKGAFLGFTMEHTRAHCVRAVLESVACMLKENLDYLKVKPTEIRSMGGGAMSPLWCNIKADMIGADIVTLKNKETACLGSAILAGVGTGVFESVEKACEIMVATDKVYKPQGVDYTECYKNFIENENKMIF